MVGRAPAVRVRHHHLPLGAEDDLLDRVGEVALLHRGVLAARGKESRLVDEQRDVGAGRARGRGGDPLEVDVGRELHVAGVNLEDLDTALAVWAVDGDAAVEPTWAKQGRVEDLGTVRRAQDDHVRARLEAVHLGEDLAERLLAFVVAAAQPGDVAGARAPDRVELVDEDDRRRRLLGLLEQVAHPRGAHADDRLDELRGRQREERGVRLARHRPRQQRLAGPGRAVEQHPVRNARPEPGVALRVLEEVDDLDELVLGLVDPGHVVEGDPLLLPRLHPPRGRAAEAPEYPALPRRPFGAGSAR